MIVIGLDGVPVWMPDNWPLGVRDGRLVPLNPDKYGVIAIDARPYEDPPAEVA